MKQNQVDAVATAAGEAPAVVSKREFDSRVYRIDCGPLLNQFEMLTKVTRVDVENVVVDTQLTRTRDGRYFDVMLSGGTVRAGAQHEDIDLRAELRTTMGSIGVSLRVKVFKL
jgi:hypothetical protein